MSARERELHREWSQPKKDGEMLRAAKPEGWSHLSPLTLDGSFEMGVWPLLWMGVWYLLNVPPYPLFGMNGEDLKMQSLNK